MGERRTIVVTGATGRQGGSVARRLLSHGWQVRAATRHPEGSAAGSLRALGIEVVAGDLDDRLSMIRAFQDAYGVFGVTDFWEHGYAGEVRQGRTMVDAAVAAGIRHFVFSSVGGADRTQGLGISHFDSKREIEEHLRLSGLRFTIFRPVTFMENFVTPRFRRAICVNGVFRFCIEPSRPFQMVAMNDVGAFVAKAFEDPARYAGQAMELASDAFTMLDFVNALSRAVGRYVRYQCMPPALQWIVAAYVGLTGTSGRYKVGRSLIDQFRWNNASDTGGWNADLSSLRVLHPGLTSLDTWVGTIDWREGIYKPQVAPH